jgi:hypothetical protein
MDQPNERPSAPVNSTDMELLRKFEPVVLFTRGEQFFPTEVNHYVEESSLWEHTPDGRDELLVKQGELTIGKLAETRPAAFGTIRYLRFVENLNLVEAAQALADQAIRHSRQGYHFRAGIGRLARGGFLPRLVDGLFSLSFLLRGSVSAATAAAAELDYNDIFSEDKKYTYYGRVVRQNGWTILQYWFFYCFNNWRSGFHGVNDHESDWEMVNIYLFEENGKLFPEWAAYASHDFKGDDLRRRWDDEEELRKIDGHPIIFAGAGSHASYFHRGEYQAEVDLPLPDWFSGLIRAWNKLWTETLGQASGVSFHIPFVDFARGDGIGIGPTRHRLWSPVLISESTAWVSQYRGLWGLYARDPISGENAPAGPMYNRDGSPRGAWYDPLGFAGLEKVPPPSEAVKMLESDCLKITRRQEELERSIPQKAVELEELGVKLKGMEGYPHLARQYDALEKEINASSAEVRALRREHSENQAVYQGLTQRLSQLSTGKKDDPRAHIRHMAIPDDPGKSLRFNRVAETWAAASLSLLLFAIAALIFFAPKYIWIWLAIILILFFVTESILRRAFIQTVAKITLLLAMFASVILLIHFWKWIIVGVLLSLGMSLLYQRLRELIG